MMFSSAPHRLIASHKHVFVEDATLADGKQSVTSQAANFATLHVAWTLDRDDLVFGFAAWAGEGDGL